MQAQTAQKFRTLDQTHLVNYAVLYTAQFAIIIKRDNTNIFSKKFNIMNLQYQRLPILTIGIYIYI